MYRVLSDCCNVFSPSQEHLRSWCDFWDIPFLSAFEQAAVEIIYPHQTWPTGVHHVPGDGDCLFTSLTTIVSGQISVDSQSVRRQDRMRQLLCNLIEILPITEQQFLFYSDQVADSADSYIRLSKMRTPGVWGGDLEIQAFATAFQLNVAIYLGEAELWVTMEPLIKYSTQIPFIYLLLRSNHFEPITRLSTVQHAQETENEICDGTKLREVRSVVSELTAPQVFPIKTHLPNVVTTCLEGEGEIVTSEQSGVISTVLCDACCRVSTVTFPLNLQTVELSKTKRRKFASLQSCAVVKLCSLCFQYLTKDKSSGTELWGVAWPCVIRSLLLNNEHWWMLPKEMRLSWSVHFEPSNKSSPPLFLDLTQEVNEFFALINSYESQKLVKALEKFSEPKVRCFCGASEFIYDCGLVPMNHLLNYLFPDFKSFESNWRTFLAPMRGDYLTAIDELLPFQFRPCLLVKSQGLMIATCRRHNEGSSRQMVHVPRHPTCGNLSHPFDNRLAPLIPSLRAASTVRVGAFSNTWTISKATGGFSGVGAMTLSNNFCPLAVKSQLLIPGKEYIFLRKRRDMFENLSRLADEYHLNKSFIDDLKCTDWEIPSNYADYLRGSSYVSLPTIASLKDKLDSEQGDVLIAPPVLQYTNHLTLGSLLLPAKRVWNKSHGFACFWVAIRNVDLLNELLISSPLTSAEPFITKFLTTGSFHNCEILKRALALQLCSPLCAVFRSIFPSTSEFLHVHSTDDLINALYEFTGAVILCTWDSNRATDINLDTLVVDFTCVLIEWNPNRNENFLMALKISATSTQFCCLNTKTTQTKVSNVVDWKGVRFAIFVRGKEAPVSACRYVSGQNNYTCPDHQIYLCLDFRGSGYDCVATGCRGKSKWRCPSADCLFSLCETHLTETLNKNFKYETSKNKKVVEEDEDFSAIVSQEPHHRELWDHPGNDLVFEPPIPTTDVIGEHADTDAGVLATPIEVNKTQDLESIPIQALFNSFTAVLNRPKYPVQATARVRRFLQTLAAKMPMCSVSLLQPEALLFPAIFYHQMKDGSFPGALPLFLYSLSSKCKQLGFEDMLFHFVTRITDLSLLTSSSIPYIQYAVDCLINCALGNHHSQAFFKKGLQSLEIGGKKTPLFQREVSFQLNDSERCVRELAAAVASEPPTLFLTLTCNQKNFPGISSIMSKVNEKFKNSTDEVKKSSIDSIMTTIVRSWSNCVRFLVEHLLKSKERILGEVKKIWGRAEFQTTVGNLPHYHILIWSKIQSLDIDETIQCAHKHIMWALQGVMKSNLGLIDNEKDLYELFDLCIKIHTHKCEKSGYRCLKRIDAEGNKVCRTPPYPVSNCHWKMPVNVQYPEEALKVMAQIGMASPVSERIPGWFIADGVMKCEKWMYGASKGEHIIPTCAHLFVVTKSSTNVLALTGSFVSSYLTYYVTKVEEHASGRITPNLDGKNFRLRHEGITNRGTASVSQLMKADKDRERAIEKVDCTLLSVTEGVHWLCQLPHVFSNMSFIHIQNVPAEDRFVASSVKRRFSKVLQLRRRLFPGDEIRGTTLSQDYIIEDSLNCQEHYDSITIFGLRSPELLCIDSMELYFRAFVLESYDAKVSDLEARASSGRSWPWINCLGKRERLRRIAAENLLQFLANRPQTDKVVYVRNIVTTSLDNIGLENDWITDEGTLIPEIVFKNVHPRNEIQFLVSFLLRFGLFHTELDLYHQGSLRCAYQFAELIQVKIVYTEDDVLSLLHCYAHNELRFLPGGSLTFSAKLISAKTAFSHLLGVEDSVLITYPAVLTGEIVEELSNESDVFKLAVKQSLLSHVEELNLANLPDLNEECIESLWFPEMTFSEHQSEASQAEQRALLQYLLQSFQLRFSCTDNQLLKNDLVLGPPGSGKSFICRIAMAFALINGFTCMVTSLAARRSNQLGGEHAHRLFHIPCRNESSSVLADRALFALSKDVKRMHYLKSLQFLLIEEISVFNGELWSAMDKVLQRVKDNFLPFGGVYVLANGDCCQLPTVSGCEIFNSSSLLFGFNFKFLQSLVRMEDEQGQLLLRLMEQRPIPEQDVDRIVHLFMSNCEFVSSWDEIDDPSVMKVFGKKSAERESIARHFEFIRQSGQQHFIAKSVDEKRIMASTMWRPGNLAVTSFLNSKAREPAELMVYDKALVRITANIHGLSQGSIGVLNFSECNENSISFYCASAPRLVTRSAIESEQYRQWPLKTVGIHVGFIMNFKGNSVRRRQFPLCNYVASNCHRLMGDGFPRMATAISSSRSKYSLWLPSQIFVIGSRVRHLSTLTFVGNRLETSHAIKEVLSKRNMKEERIYQFFASIRRSVAQQQATEIPLHPYVRASFHVPKTSNGFVFGLLSLRDRKLNTILILDTERGLSETIRQLNSSSEIGDPLIYSHQPWAPFFYSWNFRNERERLQVRADLQSEMDDMPQFSIIQFQLRIRFYFQQYDGGLLYSFCGKIDSNNLD